MSSATPPQKTPSLSSSPADAPRGASERTAPTGAPDGTSTGTPPHASTSTAGVSAGASPSLSQRLFAGGVLPALFATALWSTVFVLARMLAGKVPPAELAFWRWTFALLALLPFSLRQTRAEWPVIRKHCPYLALAGIVGFGVFSLVMFKASESTSATNLSLIAASAPVVMALLSVLLLRERLSLRQVGGLGIALSGVMVLILRGDLQTLTQLNFTPGDLWMLVSASMFALYSILVRRRPAGISQGPLLTSMLVFACLFLLPFCLWAMWQPGYQVPNLEGWLAMLFMGAGPSCAAYYSWNVAVARIGAARAGVVYYSVPLFSSLEAAYLIGEAVSLSQILGGALILGGIFLSSLDSLRHKPTPVEEG